MKKLIALVVLAAGLFTAGNAHAQTKIGYIDVSALLTAMPEYKKADTALAEYQNALNDQYADMVKEYQAKDSIMKIPGKYSAAQVDIKKQELQQLYYKVQNWNQQAQELYQSKQGELMAPIQNRALKALQDVAKENGYAYVLSRQTLVTDPPAADDLLPLVKKKLGIK